MSRVTAAREKRSARDWEGGSGGDWEGEGEGEGEEAE